LDAKRSNGAAAIAITAALPIVTISSALKEAAPPQTNIAACAKFVQRQMRAPRCAHTPQCGDMAQKFWRIALRTSHARRKGVILFARISDLERVP
jgi:hypothetical protein